MNKCMSLIYFFTDIHALKKIVTILIPCGIHRIHDYHRHIFYLYTIYHAYQSISTRTLYFLIAHQTDGCTYSGTITNAIPAILWV